ncbi:MAG: DUF4239 domain-containing protein [Candidatus Pacebacteria bacterium]|jgi:hypothetical protein|nr:hypothetical protein [Parcubacteria group bacterium]MDP6249467.1 DUF4239 domain-containing protein [Candidatus Paceibacterota bacterium]MDP7159551.1 DUF4239 domain-containing protein [Candidatus Paceibacterota bacterium]MDP7466159.1 DUF4239 domain-containing protein [Candidatus Paceibacterota bacterium]MDP7648459.1 DUF4239 domain-containing protein [Candidatus Paceibacterota bacterium]|tara:strand:+ start:771 stop:1598 length:828 start_codon:yes stop_codon:yes gene_type:complete
MLKNIFKKFLRSRYKLPITIIVFFGLAYAIPGGGVNEIVGIILGVVGLLFAIIVGFFINDLWSRYQIVRENVAVEVSGLQTYYLFVKIMKHFPDHEKWAEKQRELIDAYVVKFFEVEWHSYGEIDPYFNRIIESLKNVGELKTNNETETYTNMLPLLNEITTSREKLFMYGKDRLSKLEWSVIYFLAAILVFSIFFINTHELFSIFLVGMLSSAVTILLFILHDLNSLSYGEETVSFEPYETIFDVIEKPRFYRKRDIRSGRVRLPKDKEYRLVD